MEEIGQIKNDIGELKTNVSFIKNEVHEMRATITNAVDKISNSMAILAGVTEKLNYNVQEHKYIYERIDEIEQEQNEHKEKITELKNFHQTCMDQRKAIEEGKRNSPWQKAKDKGIEYLFIILIALTIFILFTHAKDFIEYMNSANTMNPTVISR